MSNIAPPYCVLTNAPMRRISKTPCQPGVASAKSASDAQLGYPAPTPDNGYVHRQDEQAYWDHPKPENRQEAKQTQNSDNSTQCYAKWGASRQPDAPTAEPDFMQIG